MPVRSSICTYSPQKMSTSSSKYTPTIPSNLSMGNYKPLSVLSPTSKYSNYPSTTSSNLGSSSSRSSAVIGSSISSGRVLSNIYRSFYSNSRAKSSDLTVQSTGSYTPSDYSTSIGSSRFNSVRNTYSRYSSSRISSTGTYSGTLDNDYSPRSQLSSRSSSYISALKRSSYGTNFSSTDDEVAGDDLPAGVSRGLVNLGNTCYMNASLQSLYSLEPFRNLILRLTSSKVLCSELQELFKKMRDSKTSVSPASFKDAFSRYQRKFSGLGQQDAQEFLRYLINGIHEECNAASKRPRRSAQPRSPASADEAWSLYRELVDDSPLVDLLVGQLCSTICCSVCQTKSRCWDPFWDLSLALVRGKYSCRLSDMLEDFTAKEVLESEERPVCSHCKCATKSTKQISVYKSPKILILHLKKFSNDGYKLTSADVQIDRQLVINERQYELQACISHHGHSSSSGHYTAHCRYFNSRWFHFNDDRVREVTASFDTDKLSDAYVLFYQQASSPLNGSSSYDSSSSSLSSTYGRPAHARHSRL